MKAEGGPQLGERRAFVSREIRYDSDTGEDTGREDRLRSSPGIAPMRVNKGIGDENPGWEFTQQVFAEQKEIRRRCRGSLRADSRFRSTLCFVGHGWTAGGIEDAEQAHVTWARIFEAMPELDRQEDARARGEGAVATFDVDNSIAFENEDRFLVSMVVERGLARRDESDELRDLPAAEVFINQELEAAISHGDWSAV